jgi:hypothetical protein
LKLLPVTATIVPGGPDAGVRAICGPVKTKLAEALSPELPVTVITYVPRAGNGIVFVTVNNDGETNCPPEPILHETVLIMLLGLLTVGLHAPTSAVAKPLPVIVTEVPAGPVLGVRVNVGVEDGTVKVAVAKSPVDPVTVIV